MENILSVLFVIFVIIVIIVSLELIAGIIIIWMFIIDEIKERIDKYKNNEEV